MLTTVYLSLAFGGTIENKSEQNSGPKPKVLQIYFVNNTNTNLVFNNHAPQAKYALTVINPTNKLNSTLYNQTIIEPLGPENKRFRNFT